MFFLVACALTSCKSRNLVVDYRVPNTPEEWKAFQSAPLVLVGSVEHDTEAGPRITSHWNKEIHLQLHKISVAAEVWLRGDLPRSQVDLYYYRFAQAYEGPPPLGDWEKGEGIYPDGSRRIFFIRRDGELLRLACDAKDTCTIRVGSGAHAPGDLSNAGRENLEAKIANILFTRGVGVSDREFANSLVYSRYRVHSLDLVDEQYYVPKLKQLIESSNLEIRQAACECLALSVDQQTIENDPKVRVLCQPRNAK